MTPPHEYRFTSEPIAGHAERLRALFAPAAGGVDGVIPLSAARRHAQRTVDLVGDHFSGNADLLAAARRVLRTIDGIDCCGRLGEFRLLEQDAAYHASALTHRLYELLPPGPAAPFAA